MGTGWGFSCLIYGQFPTEVPALSLLTSGSCCLGSSSQPQDGPLGPSGGSLGKDVSLVPEPFPHPPSPGHLQGRRPEDSAPCSQNPAPQRGHRASVHQLVPKAAPALGSPARTPSAPPADPGPRHADHSPSVSGSPTPSPFCHLRTAYKK